MKIRGLVIALVGAALSGVPLAAQKGGKLRLAGKGDQKKPVLKVLWDKELPRRWVAFSRAKRPALKMTEPQRIAFPQGIFATPGKGKIATARGRRPYFTLKAARFASVLSKKKRRLVKFRKFDVKDPGTGKNIAPSSMLELPNGKKISARDYYDHLNRIERFMSRKGHTARMKEKSAHVMRLRLRRSKWKGQWARLARYTYKWRKGQKRVTPPALQAFRAAHQANLSQHQKTVGVMRALQRIRIPVGDAYEQKQVRTWLEMANTANWKLGIPKGAKLVFQLVLEAIAKKYAFTLDVRVRRKFNKKSLTKAMFSLRQAVEKKKLEKRQERMLTDLLRSLARHHNIRLITKEQWRILTELMIVNYAVQKHRGIDTKLLWSTFYQTLYSVGRQFDVVLRREDKKKAPGSRIEMAVRALRKAVGGLARRAEYLGVLDQIVGELNTLRVDEVWEKNLGSKGTLAVRLAAGMHLLHTKELARGKAFGIFEGWLFNNHVKVVDGEVWGETNRTKVKAHAHLYVVGLKLFDRNWEASTIDESETLDKSVEQGVTFRFMAGPIPIAVKVGFRGRLGITFGVQVYGTRARAYCKPFAAAEGYVTAGVDIVIAGVYVGADLTFLKASLILYAELRLEPYYGELTLVNEIGMEFELNVLSGRLKVCLWIYLPAFKIPPWAKKEFCFTLFDWGGFTKKGTIFSFEKRIPLLSL